MFQANRWRNFNLFVEKLCEKVFTGENKKLDIFSFYDDECLAKTVSHWSINILNYKIVGQLCNKKAVPKGTAFYFNR